MNAVVNGNGPLSCISLCWWEQARAKFSVQLIAVETHDGVGGVTTSERQRGLNLILTSEVEAIMEDSSTL